MPDSSASKDADVNRHSPRRLAVAFDCLLPYTTGGGERLYRSYAEISAARGWSVDYLTSTQWPGSTPAAESFAVVPVVGQLNLYKEDGVRRTGPALRFAAGLFRALARRRRSYDAVIVSAVPVLNVFAARLALLGSGTKVIADYLEVWPLRQWRAYTGAVTGSVAWFLQRVAVAVTPIATAHSQLTGDRLRAEGFRGRLLVSPGLIDDRAESADVRPTSSPADPPFVLYAGRHIADKRVEALPAAVEAVRREGHDVRLVILGSGPTTAEVRAAVEAVGGDSWTALPGFVDQESLNRYFDQATVLVNPSRREGYGLVVVEAASHGTPVVLVADDDNAATELIAVGENGFVAASTAPADIAREIARALAGGPALRASTRAWYEDAVITRTVERTVTAILAAIDDEGSAGSIAPAVGEGIQ